MNAAAPRKRYGKLFKMLKKLFTVPRSDCGKCGVCRHACTLLGKNGKSDREE